MNHICSFLNNYLAAAVGNVARAPKTYCVRCVTAQRNQEPSCDCSKMPTVFVRRDLGSNTAQGACHEVFAMETTLRTPHPHEGKGFGECAYCGARIESQISERKAMLLLILQCSMAIWR